MSANTRQARSVTKAREVRLHNRRVRGYKLADGSYRWQFVRLVAGERIVTPLAISHDAMEAMVCIAKDLMETA